MSAAPDPQSARQIAYPGRPGDGWRDTESDIWVLCADGMMRMVDETVGPEDPTELNSEFGPLEPVEDDGRGPRVDRDEVLRDQRDELAARVAVLEAEGDADTQAVLAAVAGFDVLRIELPAPVARRIAKLRARFADRIAALDSASPLRTPDEWCALYGVEIKDPDGWRYRDAPKWDQPITLPEFSDRAGRSTCVNVVGADWARVGRDARAAREREGGAQ